MGSKRAAPTELTAYAAKLPKYEKTGNYSADETNKTLWAHLQEMISGCQKDPSMVAILFGKWTEARRDAAKAGEWPSHELFQPAPKNVSSLPEEYLYGFIKKHTDITLEDLQAIQKHDPKGASRIFQAMVQLPATLKLERDLQHRGIYSHMVAYRFRLCGSRWANAKKLKSFGRGQVYWADFGAYKGEFEQHKLTKVTHVSSGDSCTVDPLELMVSDKWQLVDKWSDMGAAYTFKNNQTLRLCTLFKKEPAEGPWKIPQYTGAKQQSFVEMLEKQTRAYLDEREKVSGSAHDEEEIKEAIKAGQKQRKQDTIQTAKVAASKALAKAKALRVAAASST